MDYTKIPENAFKELQLNAGILARDFDVETGVVSDILGATSGGVNFSASPSYSDFGEDIDNCPKNTMELKKLDDVEVKVSGTFITVTPKLAKGLVGAADIDSEDTTKVVPRRDVKLSDYDDLWWIGDYSDINVSEGGKNAGYCAIHLMNTLSTGGFQIQSSDKGKGQMSFEYTAHYSMSAQDTVPYEIYIKAGA